MENDIKVLIEKVDKQTAEIEAVKKSLRKIQMYFLWTLIISLLVVVLPAIGLVFAIPKFLGNFSEIQNLGL